MTTKRAKNTRLLSACVLGAAVASLPAVAGAQEAPKKADKPADAANGKKPEPPEKAKVEVGVTGTAMGVYDTNIFDKGANTIQGAGFDVTMGLNLGVPISKSFSWASGVGLGSNYRDGIGGADVGGANALRLDAHAKTGLDILLAGKGSLPGRHVKNEVFPVIKLGIEAKYALWTNPLISQPAAASDETVDALEPTEDDEDSGSSDSGGGEARRHDPHPNLMLAEGVAGAGGDAATTEAAGNTTEGEGAEEEQQGEPAEIPVGGQTFSNPNTHHKVTGLLRLSADLSKKFSLGADGGAGRDIVNLDDNVEVSPEYNEVNGGFSAKYKVSPKLLWLSAGYVFERRIYDEPGKTGAPQDFDVHGGKLAVDVPLKPVKIKLGYDLRFKLADSGSAANTTRHQIQLGLEIPIVKVLAAVVEARVTDTVLNGPPDSFRLIGLGGLKVKL